MLKSSTVQGWGSCAGEQGPALFSSRAPVRVLYGRGLGPSPLAAHRHSLWGPALAPLLLHQPIETQRKLQFS